MHLSIGEIYKALYIKLYHLEMVILSVYFAQKERARL